MFTKLLNSLGTNSGEKIVSVVNGNRIEISGNNNDRSIRINGRVLTQDEIKENTDANGDFSFEEDGSHIKISANGSISASSSGGNAIIQGISISGGSGAIISASDGPDKVTIKTADSIVTALDSGNDGGIKSSETNCPNCGGPLKSGDCPYCGTEVGKKTVEKIQLAGFNIVRGEKNIDISSAEHRNTIFVDCEIDSLFNAQVGGIIGGTLHDSSSSEIGFILNSKIGSLFNTEIGCVLGGRVQDSSSSTIGVVNNVLVNGFNTETDSLKMKEKFAKEIELLKSLEFAE